MNSPETKLFHNTRWRRIALNCGEEYALDSRWVVLSKWCLHRFGYGKISSLRVMIKHLKTPHNSSSVAIVHVFSLLLIKKYRKISVQRCSTGVCWLGALVVGHPGTCCHARTFFHLMMRIIDQKVGGSCCYYQAVQH